MVLATASAASGVLILVAPYASPAVAIAVAVAATLPLMVLWRSLAAEDTELSIHARSRPRRAPVSFPTR
jgi:hypothetical protein